MKRLRLILGGLIAVAAVSLAVTAMYILRGAPILDTSISPEAATASLEQQKGIEITYIANEGVLISSGDKQVLIDGLHRKERVFSHYAFLPTAEREKIETAQPPYDKIDLLLFSHRHYDHFHAEAAGLHLKHNPKTRLVSSHQVVSEVEKNFKDYKEIEARVISTTPPLKERVAVNIAGIDFELLGLGHGSGSFREIQNLGHLIKLGGKKLLHVGDAELETEIFEKFNLDEEGIDIAILPFWFLVGKDGQTIVKEHIKPKHIIAVHIETMTAAKIASQIKEAFPDATTFTTMLEKKRY
jgi:L-ascorbate metabolism protein UlaG (beta-lactamase superfamily)